MKVIFLLFLLPIFVTSIEDDIWQLPVKPDCTEKNGCLPISVPLPAPTIEPRNPFMDGIFTVIAPGVIRRGKPFNVAVKGFKTRQTTKLGIQISGTDYSGLKYKFKKFAKISKQKPKALVQFSTFNIPNGTYELCVMSDRGYADTKNLTYIQNEFSFLIQTDKALYFPSNIIKFRIFAVDSETKAATPKSQVDVSILDGSGTLVRSFKGVKFSKGKYQAEVELPDRPAFGLWQIYVESGEDSSSKHIEVASYEVPIIYASLAIQESIPFSLRTLPVRIDAKYSFNEEVDGIATVIFERFGTEYFRKRVEIQENVANFDVDVLSDLKAVSSQSFSYDVRLEYHDQLTNTTVTDFASFSVLPAVYSIILNGDAILQPNKPFEYSVVLQKYDGSPAPEGTTVTVSASPLELNQTLHVDANGYARSSFPFSVNSSYLFITATAVDAVPVNLTVTLPFSKVIDGVAVSQNSSVPSMRVDVVTKDPTIDSQVQVEVISSENVDSINCFISAKGILLEILEVSVYDVNNRLFRFSFQSSITHAPITSIICYYIKKDGQVVTASTNVEFTGQLTNYLSLSVGKTEYKPGERIEVQIESKLYSTVSLVAVDQRIVTLRNGHSVTKPEVFSSLMKYYRLVAIRKNAKVPDYEFNFNMQGLLFFTNIPAPDECPDHEFPVLFGGNDRLQLSNQVLHTKGIKSPEEFGASILWKNVDIRTSIPGDATYTKGRETVTELAISTVSSYILYGVSMNFWSGIGLPTTFPTFKIFRPFFISAEFPYSIKRTEILTQSITVFNFLRESQTFDVVINKDPKYEIASASEYGWIDAGDHYARTITSEVGVHSRLKFALKGTKTGIINFSISARGPLAGDSIDRVLRIEPFDIIKSVTDSRMINIRESETIITDLQCVFPDTKMENLDASVSYSGDILGRPLASILETKGLINLPRWCGEQTLFNMVPDVVTYLYLKATNQLKPDISNILIDYARRGYANMQQHLRTDGAFSAWGQSTPGSTWLTAYAGWAFYLSKDIVSIDMNVLRRGLNFIVARQLADGSFQETGPLIYEKRMQGGSGNGIAMTAYITNYIFTVLNDFPEFDPMYRRAIAYLEDNWYKGTDSYQLAIIGYALKSANSPKADNVMNFFYMRRTETDTEIYYQNIETTAYCLLMLLARGEKRVDATKMATYLIRKSNSFGGYHYTQDTVMALYALSKFGSLYSYTGRISLSMEPNIGAVILREITYSNSLETKRVSLSPLVDKVKVTATSSNNGFAVVSLQCGFRAESLDFEPAFLINHQYTFTCRNKIYVQLLINFVPEGQSGMTIATVDLPSGFVFTEVINSPDVRLVEQASNGEVVTFYFDNIGNEPIPVTLAAVRTRFVDSVMGGRVSVLDYYNPGNEAYLSFVLPDLTNSCGIVFRK